MSHVSHYKEGQHLFICDVCGTTHHSEKKKVMWDGKVTCGRKGCFELRHPQDFVRGVKDDQTVKDNPRPRQTLSFLSAGEVTADSL
jgi:Fe2+ or Zn2+ uptake regulation protein